MKRTLMTILSTILLTSSGVVETFAAGKSGSTPYTPYNGHPPVNTSMGGLMDLVVIVGIAAYIVGLAVIVLSSKLKAKINE